MPISEKELAMLYKAETAQGITDPEYFARVGRYGDVIIDQFYLDDAYIEHINQTKKIIIHDEDYVKWLEEKLMELLSNKS